MEIKNTVVLNPLLKLLTYLIVIFRRAKSLLAGVHKIILCINLFCT